MCESHQTNPQFVHDCDACTFLGTTVQKDQSFDLYHCSQGDLPVGPTVIARFGSEGNEYLSGMVFAKPGTVLGEARDRAIQQGLIV